MEAEVGEEDGESCGGTEEGMERNWDVGESSGVVAAEESDEEEEEGETTRGMGRDEVNDIVEGVGAGGVAEDVVGINVKTGRFAGDWPIGTEESEEGEVDSEAEGDGLVGARLRVKAEEEEETAIGCCCCC